MEETLTYGRSGFRREQTIITVRLPLSGPNLRS